MNNFNFAPATAVERNENSADAIVTESGMPKRGASPFDSEPNKAQLEALGVNASNYSDFLAGKFQPKSLGGIFDLLPKNTGIATKEQCPSIRFTVAEIRVIPVAARLAELRAAKDVASAASLEVVTQQITSLESSKSPVVVAIPIKNVSSLKSDGTWENTANCTLEYRGQIEGLDMLRVGGEFQLNCRKNYLGKKPAVKMAAAHDRKSALNEKRGFDKLYDGDDYKNAVIEGLTYWFVPNAFVEVAAVSTRR